MGRIWDYSLGLNKPLNKIPEKYTKRILQKRSNIKAVGLKHTRQFHRQKHRIIGVIRSTIGPREIIYGEHALKARFPKYLERPTTDIDVYSPTPRHDARQAERKLDRVFGGDFFYVKKAQHPGTVKVVAHANQEGYADFTEKPQHLPYDTIRGHKYLKLSVEKEHRIRILKDPNYKFRWSRDQDALNRIKIFEKIGEK